MHADLQPLLADELLADVGTRPLEDLRQVRVDLTRAEGDVSLVRRITQGRLDIVGHEVGRRGRDLSDPPPEAPADTTALLYEMPEILSDPGPSQHRSAGAGRLTPVAEPGPLSAALIEQLDAVASPNDLAGVAELAGDVLVEVFERLRAFEVELSGVRRALHDRIDTIQDEIARRYRDGEASVDALLR